MLIEITKFKFYDEKVIYEFKEQDLNLLKGQSNCGKTTVFEAIYWCLYGSNKVVYPKSLKASVRDPTIVKITFENKIEIERSKPPDNLTVTANALLYNESAQEWIDQYFGTKMCFLATTYMKQKRENPLLELKLDDKKILLRELTFGKQSDSLSYEDPQFYMEKIDAELKVVKNDITATRSAVSILSQQFEKHARSSEKYSKIWYNIETRDPTSELIDNMIQDNIKNEKTITNLKSQLKTCRREWETYNFELLQYDKNTKTLVLLENELKLIPYTKPILDDFLNNISLYEKYTSKKTQLDTIRSSITDREFDYLERNITNIDSIKTIASEIKEFQKMVKTLEFKEEKDLTLNIVKRDIEAKLAQYEKILLDHTNQATLQQNYQKQYNAELKAYQMLKKERDLWLRKCEERKTAISATEEAKLKYDSYFDHADVKLALSVADINIEDTVKSTLSKFYTAKNGFSKLIDIYREIIFQTTRKNTTYSCPNCSTNLEIKDNVLCTVVLSTVKSPDLNVRATKAISTIQKIERLLQEYKIAKTLSDNLTSDNSEEPPIPEIPETIKDVTLLSAKEVENIRTRIRLLQTLRFPNISILGYDNDDKLISVYDKTKLIDLAVNSLNNYKHYLILLQNLPDFVTSNNTLTKRQIQDYYTTISSLNSRIVETKKSIKDCHIKEPTVTISFLETSVIDLETSIKTNNTLIESGKRLIEFKELKTSLDESKTKFDSLIERQVCLDKIKQNISETESYALEETVDSINSILMEITSILYDNDTHITLSMFKKLKTRDYLKAQPTIIVSRGYGENEIVYDIDELSGGEKSRLSLALTIALSTISSSILLFIDEGMSSMHPSLRDKCLKVIRSHTNNKTVINVCHGIVEGIHSNCVEINSGSD